MTRVVSLLPSATEIVCALGREGDLVGRSEECDFPPAVRRLPVVMRARSHDFDRPPGEVDERVRAALGSAESLYSLDLGLLRSLAPDVILTQDLCRVCSVTDDEVRTACREAGVRPLLVSLTPTRLDEVWQSIVHVASALGENARGEALAEALARRARPPGPPSSGSPPVVVLEWLDPPIVAGLWVPEMIAAAGGRPWGVEPGGVGRRTTWSELEGVGPGLVILAPCSYPVGRTREEARAPPVASGLARLRPPGGVWLADEAYFSRPGPRLADGVELVRQLVRASTMSGFAGERYEGPALGTRA